MKKSRLLGAVCASFAILLFNNAQATLLTFDDLTPLGYDAAVLPSDYGGLTWQNFGYVNGSLRDPAGTSGSGYYNGRVSGDYVAYNQGGGCCAYIKSLGSLFDFNGVYITAAHHDGLFVNVQGYNGAELLYDATVNPLRTAPTWYQRNGPRILDSRLSVFCPHIMRPDHAATGHITLPA
jgi:hypothetical protein